jgi:hypothetical protein
MIARQVKKLHIKSLFSWFSDVNYMRYDSQHNDTQSNVSVPTLGVIYAECRYAKCLVAEYIACNNRDLTYQNWKSECGGNPNYSRTWLTYLVLPRPQQLGFLNERLLVVELLRLEE